MREQWHDSDTGVTTNDCNVLIGRVCALYLGHEAGGTNDIERGDTEETLWVVDALALVDLSADWDCRIDLLGIFLALYMD